MDIATKNYRNFEGNIKVKRRVYGMISRYREILWERNFQARQSTSDAFFRKNGNKMCHSRAHLPVRKANLYTLHVFCKEFIINL
jgi:hypothetical protein